jgi:AcrR family transcriptional regulator
MTPTRARILEVARRLFNEHGLHRVGVRDIARATAMSPGNLAYHFPTKDDLVAALVIELHETNVHTIFAALPDDFSLATLYRSAIASMRLMLRYRFILLSYVDAVTASPALAKLEASLAIKRRHRHDRMIALLLGNGYLDARAYSPRAQILYEQGQMISSGWLVAAALRGERDDDAAVLHYAKIGCALLDPYLTKKGTREMRRILTGKLDANA